MDQSSPQLNPVCLNCSAELTGKYCQACGQKDLPARQDTRDLIINFISSFYSFESKFFNTFKSLLFKPGSMIKDYNNGKRERYYHPARMYVFLSFVFFLVLSLVADRDFVEITQNGRKLSDAEKAQYFDSLQQTMDSVDSKLSGYSVPIKTVEQYDSIENSKPEKERDGFLMQRVKKKLIQEGGNYQSLMASFAQSFTGNIPKMIFFLLPMFALLLMLLYKRHNIYYSEHLVFSVFFYDFLFLIGTIIMLVALIPWLKWTWILFSICILIYLFQAIRVVYGQSFGKSLLKFSMLVISFIFVLCMALIVNSVVTLILL